ncbi:MAG: hypothetical protein AAFN93_19265 [Bacteroidota bacterium]
MYNNRENKDQSVTQHAVKNSANNRLSNQAVGLESVGHRKLAQLVDNSKQVAQSKAFQAMANNSAQVNDTIQLQAKVSGSISPFESKSTIQPKTDEEKSTKQQRVARARATINHIAPNFNNNMAGHLFDGRPANGGNVDQNNPEGLHCYRDGQLPDININNTNGSTSKIHTINWDWNGNNPKNSTMFPDWLSEDNVKALIGLKYPALVNGGLPDPAYPNSTRTYIKRGYEFDFSRHGDTVYPD